MKNDESVATLTDEKLDEISCTHCNFDGVVADTNKFNDMEMACPRCNHLCTAKVGIIIVLA